MKVILTRDIPKVGRDGEIITVADGYARNYLFPRQLALVANRNVVKQHEARLARESAKTAATLTTAQQQGEKLRDQTFTLLGKTAGNSTRLFGSVTEADVAEKIKAELGIVVDKRRISLIDPIKLIGVYPLTARLHPEVTVPFTVEVMTPELQEAREKAKLAEAEAEARAAAAAAAAAAPTPEPVAETPAETEA